LLTDDAPSVFGVSQFIQQSHFLPAQTEGDFVMRDSMRLEIKIDPGNEKEIAGTRLDGACARKELICKESRMLPMPSSSRVSSS
jgi:hypothetical protein